MGDAGPAESVVEEGVQQTKRDGMQRHGKPGSGYGAVKHEWVSREDGYRSEGLW